MAQESRVKKSLLNARVNLIFYFLTLALSFFSRKLFLDCLGAEFIGLTGTLYNLLGFLNLAELGIGSAIGYVLYKPLFDQNKARINEIISVMGYLYRWIGLIILGAGCVLACFLPWIFPATGFDLTLIYFAYFTFLISSLIGYFINYRQNLLGADQRNYVVTAYYQTTNIIKLLIQMTLAYYTGSYYYWVAIELAFGIIYSFILNWRINQTYPWLRSEVKQGRQLFRKYPEVMKYTKQLFIQKMSYFVQYQTVPFLIYAFVSLKIVAFYGNYTIITDKISQMVNTFMEGSGASVGNLIAEGNMDKTVSVFWELLSIRYLIGGIVSFSVYTLIEPFISLWLGSEYLLPKLVLVLITVNIFISYTRGGVMQFLFGFGLFYDVWAPVAEIIINLSVATICGALWGLPGVLLGGLASQLLIVCIWKPYFLYSKGFKQSVWRYWKSIAFYFSSIFMAWAIMEKCIMPFIAIQPSSSFVLWTVYAIIVVASYSVICFANLLIATTGMRRFTFRFLKLRKKP